MKFLKDSYSRKRGGYSRLLDITCTSCSGHVCFYQKDGPGILKRMYVDRIFPKQLVSNQPKSLECKKCKSVLGALITYKKENRSAYRLFVGAVSKKVISIDKFKV